MHGPLNVERQTVNVCCTTGHNIQKMEVCHVYETEFCSFSCYFVLFAFTI